MQTIRKVSLLRQLQGIRQIRDEFRRCAGERFDRIPEKMVMDDEAQVAAYDQAVRTSIVPVHRAFVRMASALLPRGESFISIADFGSGQAGLAILLAKAIPRARVNGSELSEPMLARARRNIADAQLTDRVTIFSADATCTHFVPPGNATLGTSLWLLHQLPRVEDAIASLRLMHTLTHPDRGILVMDFVRPPTQRIVDMVVEYTGPGTRTGDEDLRNSLRAGFSPEEWSEIVRRSEIDGLKIAFATGDLPLLVALYREGRYALRKQPASNAELPPCPGSPGARLMARIKQAIIERDFRRGGFPYL